MTTNKVLSLLAVAALALILTGLLTGWRPRFGVEAYFQQLIHHADVSNRYDLGGKGWESEDVSDKVCDRLDASVMQSLGEPTGREVNWGPVGSEPTRIEIWNVMQDKGLLASCQDHSVRYLILKVDREKSTCTAAVTVMPTCDP